MMQTSSKLNHSRSASSKSSNNNKLFFNKNLTQQTPRPATTMEYFPI